MAEKKSPVGKKSAAAKLMTQQIPAAPKPEKKAKRGDEKGPRSGPRGGR